jgi:hypothetical protein
LSFLRRPVVALLDQAEQDQRDAGQDHQQVEDGRKVVGPGGRFCELVSVVIYVQRPIRANHECTILEPILRLLHLHLHTTLVFS